MTSPTRKLQPVDESSAEVIAWPGRAVYTVREISRLLSISLGGAYALVRDGTIPALRVGGRWVIPKSRFHAWLDGQVEEPEAQHRYIPAPRSPRPVERPTGRSWA